MRSAASCGMISTTATVPGVWDSRGASGQPACSHPRRRRQVLTVAAGAPAGHLRRDRAQRPPQPTQPADRCSPTGSCGLKPCLTACKPRRGYPAARLAPLPVVRPAPQGLPRREAGFEPAASPARTPDPAPARGLCMQCYGSCIARWRREVRHPAGVGSCLGSVWQQGVRFRAVGEPEARSQGHTGLCTQRCDVPGAAPE